MKINSKNSKHTFSLVKWAIVAVLGSGSAAPRVGYPVVSTNSCQTRNGSKMGTKDVSTYTVGMVWKWEWWQGSM